MSYPTEICPKCHGTIFRDENFFSQIVVDESTCKCVKKIKRINGLKVLDYAFTILNKQEVLNERKKKSDRITD